MGDMENDADDVMDEDLMKELGISDDDVKATQAPGQARPAVPAPRPQAPPIRPAASAARPAARPAAGTAPGSTATATARTAPPASTPAANLIPSPPAEVELGEHNARIAADVPVQLAVVMAKQAVRLKDILQLKVGDVMDFKRPTTEPVDLVGNGKLVAKVELVLVDGKVGVRVLKLIK